MKRNYNKGQGGYVTLISVLVVGVVGLAIALTLLLLGLNASQTSFAIQESYQAKALADLCGEEALQAIRNLSTFIGLGSVSDGGGVCNYRVSDLGPPESKLIEVSGTVGTVARYLEINIDGINPAINVVSWQEVEFISGL